MQANTAMTICKASLFPKEAGLSYITGVDHLLGADPRPWLWVKLPDTQLATHFPQPRVS